MKFAKGLKTTPTHVLSFEFCEFFKNTYFVEHLRKVGSETPVPGSETPVSGSETPVPGSLFN